VRVEHLRSRAALRGRVHHCEPVQPDRTPRRPGRGVRLAAMPRARCADCGPSWGSRSNRRLWPSAFPREARFQ
jgi:hypothetical protein